MTDKERITEILKAYTKKHNIMASSVILEEYAEELLANGVIVPPCKVGDVVYEFGCTDPFGDQVDLYVVKSTVSGIAIFTTEDIHNMNCVGKTIFLTKEEAENALAERSEGNE